MKSPHWKSHRVSAKKSATLQKLERKRTLIEQLTHLSGKDLGTVALREPSLVAALSLVRAKDLEK
jgi:hypothetical protein